MNHPPPVGGHTAFLSLRRQEREVICQYIPLDGRYSIHMHTDTCARARLNCREATEEARFVIALYYCLYSSHGPKCVLCNALLRHFLLSGPHLSLCVCYYYSLL